MQKDQLDQIKNEFKEKISHIEDIKDLEELRVQFLGKKGAITQFMKGMGKLSKEERPIVGKKANEVRKEIQDNLDSV